MAIPDYQSIMLPLLKFHADQQEHFHRDATDYLAQTFNLSEEEKKELLPSGKQTIFASRVNWAKVYLKMGGLLESTRRKYYKITQRGSEILKHNPSKIDIKFLEQFPDFVEWRKKSKIADTETQGKETEIASQQTPEESLEYAYQKIRQDLAQELLSLVKRCSPAFFERLVVELLVKMGYGGSIKDAGTVKGKSGDGGIDGVIKEDKLGLDIIYIQAKRWDDGVVGRPEIQKFVGALAGHRAKKGIFLTTSNFSKEARDYISTIDSKIVLIDGEQLANLMIDYDLGVSKITAYEIKRIDSDYFDDNISFSKNTL